MRARLILFFLAQSRAFTYAPCFGRNNVLLFGRSLKSRVLKPCESVTVVWFLNSEGKVRANLRINIICLSPYTSSPHGPWQVAMAVK